MNRKITEKTLAVFLATIDKYRPKCLPANTLEYFQECAIFQYVRGGYVKAVGLPWHCKGQNVVSRSLV